MDPINYDAGDPGAAILSGLKLGAGLRGIQQDAQINEAKLQQAQLAQQQAQQQQADLRALAINPNASSADYAAIMTKYPSIAEHVGKAYSVLDEGQKQNRLDTATRIYSLLQAGRYDDAAQIWDERAKADPKNAQQYQTYAALARSDQPQLARNAAGLSLAAVLGPDKFAEAYGKIGSEQRAQEQAPADLRKKVADASAAESTATINAEKAKVAPQSVLLDLQKKGWDITKIQADIQHQKEANRIATMNAVANREGNDLKRQELKLKIQETETKLADKIREKVATAEAGAANIDNMLNTVERIRKNPALNDVLGSVEGSVIYPNTMAGVLSPFSANTDERSDAIALIDTLGSQAFLSQIPAMKGTGALTEKEGDKLQASLQNLSRKQSEAQFRANLDEASRLMRKARENLSRATGVPLGKPDTPAAPNARPPLSSFQGK